MNSALFQVTTKIESQLSGIYSIINRKEKKIAAKIKSYSKTKISRARQALILHLTFNLALIAFLFYYLY